MGQIELRNVSLKMNGTEILSNINLTIADQEYFTIVGPTGAGKSSLIAIIAGLYQPTEGQILFDNKDITHLPANQRNCGFMFESYALFPHLTVMNNICYAQHMKTQNKKEISILGQALLDLVKLTGRDFAFPAECSGGMQQRVALARALMALEKDGILILDEPFKALDAGLRLNLRREVHRIAKNKNLKITTIHVTNDMEEAMIGDKIVVLNNGRIEQIGEPNQIMYSPRTRFVAEFFSTELNSFTGTITAIDEIPDEPYLRIQTNTLHKVEIQTREGLTLYAKTSQINNGHSFQIGDHVEFLVRPQYFKALHGHRKEKPNALFGLVKQIKFMGSWFRMEVELTQENGQEPKVIIAEVPARRVTVYNFSIGEQITLYYASEYVLVFPLKNNNEK